MLLACSDASPGFGLATNHGLSDAFADESYYTTGISADQTMHSLMHKFICFWNDRLKPRQTKSIFVMVKIIACKGLYSKYGSISYRLDAMGDFRLFVPFKLILHIKHRSISHRLGTNYAFHFRAFMHKFYLNVPCIKLDTYFSSPQLRKADD